MSIINLFDFIIFLTFYINMKTLMLNKILLKRFDRIMDTVIFSSAYHYNALFNIQPFCSTDNLQQFVSVMHPMSK